MLATGCRVSEALALEWRDVNALSHQIRIEKSMDIDGTVKAPKSDAGTRTNTIDADTFESLVRLYRFQAEAFGKLGLCDADGRLAPDAPVFAANNAARVDYANLGRWWGTWRKAHGFDGLLFHELRYTQVTHLLDKGIPLKTVQARVGHADAKTTLDCYARPVSGRDADAAAVMESLFDGDDETAAFDASKVIPLKRAI